MLPVNRLLLLVRRPLQLRQRLLLRCGMLRYQGLRCRLLRCGML
jgi:hypothetical protein